MDRVVIVGAGLYGLIMAKTYLQVSGAYDSRVTIPDDRTDPTDSIPSKLPPCFTGMRHQIEPCAGTSLLVLDSASDIGGTWAEERLYPNLLSQNSYGMYEFSDLPLAQVTPADSSGVGQQFIAGWKINCYLHVWTEKWHLKKHIRLGWRVECVRRLASKEWELEVEIHNESAPTRKVKVVCDKLILATGLTSMPNSPAVSMPGIPASKSVMHAKDVGTWARNNLGYHPLPRDDLSHHQVVPKGHEEPLCKSVAIYGGAKSAFDLVHFFATLHQTDTSLHLKKAPSEAVKVHWIIREDRTGPAWMTPPTSTSPFGEAVPSDKGASIRLVHYLDPCCGEEPKRLAVTCKKGGLLPTLSLKGSWLARFFHGNPLGRWWIRRFWYSVDQNLQSFAGYQTDSKMQLLRPSNSVISCVSPIGIANQPDFWDTIRAPNVSVYRSSIEKIEILTGNTSKDPTEALQISLANQQVLPAVDLLVHATGYKPIVPIAFEPPSLRLQLGLSALLTAERQVSNTEKEHEPWVVHISEEDVVEKYNQKWKQIDSNTRDLAKKQHHAMGCHAAEREPPSWSTQSQLLPYRLFRRMVSAELVHEGDRSFAAMGVLYTSTVAVVAEVQALWVTAFLTGGFDSDGASRDGKPRMDTNFQFDHLSQSDMESTISEDVVVGSMTGTGLEVDAVHYNDMLMRDLGLNPYRLGGGMWRELVGSYEPSVYAGIVDEWRAKQNDV
ncbi:Uncharacterized protein PECH_003517 [Penicillium ucsense]|uniref:L-ornithine N(5)-oxygenase n=1 Tax=Penicillium ucsense TaxID=2839758 RepID=A0A8J8W0I3_9EURO|nr:Uncharacterized protein PECM_007406 [Penicillium ucsense]KAF7737597.1 Uncharacterized protein PECH_003517 [Penicillium ucsense]